MQIQILFAIGCPLSEKIRRALVAAIADARLPIVVELVEHQGPPPYPIVLIDGIPHSPLSSTVDDWQETICQRWFELTRPHLFSATCEPWTSGINQGKERQEWCTAQPGSATEAEVETEFAGLTW